MKRLLAAALFFLASISLANAQALVVASCGTPPPTYTKVGDVLPFTVDTTGKLCSVAGGGGGTPGGSNTQVQYNNSGSFGGITNLTTNGTNPLLTAIAAPATPAAGFGVLYLDSTNKVLSLKNDAGTVSITTVPSTAPANQFATSLSAAGVIGYTQPSFANLSGAIGSSPQLAFNNSGTEAGASGTSWDNTNLALTITGATVTTSNPILNLSQTWNNAAVNFTGLRLNITDTASNAGSSTTQGSNLIDLQRGGGSMFAVYKGTNTDPTIWMARGGSDGSAVTIEGGAGVITFTRIDTAAIVWLESFSSTVGLFLNSAAPNAGFGWGTAAGNFDLALFRASAGILSQSNGANAQTYRAYNTTDSNTSPTNYERGIFDWTTTANTLTIGTQKGGTGTLRDVLFTSGGTFGITVTGASGRVQVNGNAGSGGGVDASFNSGGLSFGLSAYTLLWNSSGTATVGQDLSIGRAAPNVFAIGDGSSNNSNGWYQWAGQKRVTADVTFTSTTTLATVTGLSVTVQAGRTYSFTAEISWTDAAAGGLQLAIAGTATATNIIYDGWIIDSGANGIKGNTQATALATAVASSTTTGTAGHATITGTITVNAAGTLLVQAAQNTSNATATTIKRGSTFIVQDMP